MQKKIIFFLLALFLIPVFVFAQNYKVQQAYDCTRAGKLDSAKYFIELSLQDDNAWADFQTWYIKGFIFKELYKKYEINDYKSKYRDIALEDFKTAYMLDINNQSLQIESTSQNIKFLGSKYFNDAKRMVEDDPVYATHLYEKYIQASMIINANIEKNKLCEIYMIIGNSFQNKFEMISSNKKNGFDGYYYSMAKKFYEKALILDSTFQNIKLYLAILESLKNQKKSEYLSYLGDVKDMSIKNLLTEQNLKNLQLEKNKTEAENHKNQISLLNKDKELKSIEIKKRESDLKKQQLLNYSLVAGVLLVSIILIIAISGYQQKKKANEIIQEQKQEVEKQKEVVEEQNHLIKEKQKEILDSIHYAKRLQEAILPPLKFIDEHVLNNFVLYQPKDVVAGDFYWAESKDNKFFIAAADCTGHGVPGAMVSVVCSNALNRTVNEFGITDTGKILDKTRELVLETFAKGNAEVKDGMDISLLCIDKQNNKAFWSGANNPLWYVQSSETSIFTNTTVTSSEVEKSTDAGLDFARPDIQLIEIKADKQPIGKTDYAKPFTTHEIALQEGMLFYLFTDGYADQFGGPKGKKFKYKQLEELLLANANKSMYEQHEILSQQFELWKGNLEQVDDVCVIGVRV